jgi:D-alanine-D-alanine ligase
VKILVLGGGISAEKAVSERSARAVLKALLELGHEAEYLDPAGQLDVVRQRAKAYDLVMPILHGTGGEDGSIQRVLDEAGATYLGSSAEASELCFDKVRLKELLVKNDIWTPKSQVVTAETFAGCTLTKAPFVLKPAADGSSVGIIIARTLPYDAQKAAELLARYPEMLLEELIEGVEITVPVLGEIALPVVEIVPPAGGEFDYENKYNGATTELCPPRNVSAEVQEQAQRLAERIHHLANARHLSRTDMIVTPAGRLYVLEINTLPGLTDQSLFPKGAAAAGIDWTALVARLVGLAAR